jgi:hypothetical protein
VVEGGPDDESRRGPRISPTRAVFCDCDVGARALWLEIVSLCVLTATLSNRQVVPRILSVSLSRQRVVNALVRFGGPRETVYELGQEQRNVQEPPLSRRSRQPKQAKGDGVP